MKIGISARSFDLSEMFYKNLYENKIDINKIFKDEKLTVFSSSK